MSCPTCSHTLQCIGGFTWWCPRCGTIVQRDILKTTYVPKLVSRCREFQAKDLLTAHISDHWKILGIRESINLPEAR